MLAGGVARPQWLWLKLLSLAFIAAAVTTGLVAMRDERDWLGGVVTFGYYIWPGAGYWLGRFLRYAFADN